MLIEMRGTPATTEGEIQATKIVVKDLGARGQRFYRELKKKLEKKTDNEPEDLEMIGLVDAIIHQRSFMADEGLRLAWAIRVYTGICQVTPGYGKDGQKQIKRQSPFPDGIVASAALYLEAMDPARIIVPHISNDSAEGAHYVRDVLQKMVDSTPVSDNEILICANILAMFIGHTDTVVLDEVIRHVYDIDFPAEVPPEAKAIAAVVGSAGSFISSLQPEDILAVPDLAAIYDAPEESRAEVNDLADRLAGENKGYLGPEETLAFAWMGKTLLQLRDKSVEKSNEQGK